VELRCCEIALPPLPPPPFTIYTITPPSEHIDLCSFWLHVNFDPELAERKETQVIFICTLTTCGVPSTPLSSAPVQVRFRFFIKMSIYSSHNCVAMKHLEKFSLPFFSIRTIISVPPPSTHPRDELETILTVHHTV